MERINLPDGSTVNLPDNIDPQERALISAQIKRDYGIDIDQTTVLGQAAEIPKGILRGAAGLAVDVPLGISALLDVGDDGKITKGLQALKKQIREDSPLAAEAGYEDTFVTKLSEGVGSFIPFLGAGMAGRALSKAPATRLSREYFRQPQFTLPVSLAVPTGIAQQADRVQAARAMGEEVGGGAETISELIGGAIGITEVLPIAGILGKFPKRSMTPDIKERIMSALRAGTEEGAQEALAGIAQDLTARGLYSDKLPIGESILDEFTIGGIIGFGADLIVNSMDGKYGVGNLRLKEQEQNYRNTNTALEDKKAFDNAVAAGIIDLSQPATPDKPRPELDIPTNVTENSDLAITQDANGRYILVDNNNLENPVIYTSELEGVEGELDVTERLVEENQKQENAVLNSRIENALYSLGLPQSNAAMKIGTMLYSPNTTSIDIKTLYEFDQTSDAKKKAKNLDEYIDIFDKKVAEVFDVTPLRERKSLPINLLGRYLTKKDQNNLFSRLSQEVMQSSEKAGMPSIRDDKSEINTTIKAIKKLAESKNIDLDVDSPAFNYFVKQLTGAETIRKASKQARELVVARLHSLPAFNIKTEMPSFEPRGYSAKDVADFVAETRSQNLEFTENDLIRLADQTAKTKNKTLNRIAKSEKDLLLFLSDLIYSGRVEKKGKKYKFRDNFEFDIARRAEGFNETPQEYGARLRTEGKLPEEVIVKMVEEETTKQQNYLPPEEAVSKSINFAQAIEEGRLNKFAREAKKMLDGVGLKETGVVVSDDILSSSALVTRDGNVVYDPTLVEGLKSQYDKNSDIIFLSLNSINPDGLATDAEIQSRITKIIDKEVVSALRQKDLINEKEFNFLKRKVKSIKVPESYDPNYANQSFLERSRGLNSRLISEMKTAGATDQEVELMLQEDAIANLYSARGKNLNVSPRAEGIFGKINQFFKSMGQAMRRSGFDSVNEIFESIEEGRIGARTRGKVRTLKDISRFEFEDFARARAIAPFIEEEVDQNGNAVVSIKTPISNPKDTRPIEIRTASGLTIPSEVYSRDKLSEGEYRIQRQEILDLLKKEGMSGGGDGIKFIEFLRNYAPSNDYKMIASKVLDAAKRLKKLNKVRGKTKEGLEFEKESPPLTFKIGGLSNARGMFTPYYNKITLAKRNKNTKNWRAEDGINWETMLHEAIHAVTVPSMYAYQKGKISDRKTRKLYENLEELQKLTIDYFNNLESDLTDLSSEYFTALDGSEVDSEVAQRLEELRDKIQKRYDSSNGLEKRYIEYLFDSNVSYVGIDKPVGEELNFFKQSNLSVQKLQINFRKGKLRDYIKDDIDYKTLGKQKRRTTEKQDVSEFLTFGLTNRAFQETLEQIPYTPKDQTLWSKFVNSIREYLGMSPKENTVLSGFLQNSSVLIDVAGLERAGSLESDTELILRERIDDEISEIDQRIQSLQDAAYKRERELATEQMSDRTRSRLMAERDSINREVADLIQQKKELQPDTGQLSLFERSATYDSKPEIYPYGKTEEDVQRIARDNRNRLKNEEEFIDDPDSLEDLIEEYIGEELYVQEDGSILPDRFYFPNVPLTSSSETLSRRVLIDNGYLEYFSGNIKPSEIFNNNRNQDKYFEDLGDNKFRIYFNPDGYKRRQVTITNPNLYELMEETWFDSATASTSEKKKRIEAVERAEEIIKSTPNGEIPLYNANASDVALEAAVTHNEDATAKEPPADVSGFNEGQAKLPEDYQGLGKKVGVTAPKQSWGARMIEYTSDPITNIKNTFRSFRQNYIDKLDKIDKAILRGIETNEDVRRANNLADTATMAALRMADKARGIFQGMLTRGYVTDTVEGENALTNTEGMPIKTKYNDFIDGNESTGGLIHIVSPLFSDPNINKEGIFQIYATLKRKKSFDEQGKEVVTPVSSKDLEYIQKIETEFPEVVEVYQNYQNWNNKLITFAEAKGLLDKEQANLWREHSSYYPFYRNMVDEGLAGPNIASGSLPNNPLSIKIKGSEEAFDISPVEAIARNSLSILTASMKNDGLSKLVRDFQSMDMARPLKAGEQLGLDTIFVFENGEKKYYRIDDIELLEGIQAVGGVGMDGFLQMIAMPSSLLRDTVTRDPGFVVVNILRDTLSSAVTSGAPLGQEGFTPVIDSFKNMFADMENLEKFGVIGGYDFQNDEGSVKDFINRAMRKEGLAPDNGMTASSAFFKVWDGLGALTTKSDGATRKAVYDAVYNKLKSEGYTEAQAQSEAAYQGLEIINFGRRGLSPTFRIVTAAIPFFNARIQGLDVLFRSFTGKYSSIEKLQEGQSLEEVQNQIIKTAFTRGSFLMFLTALYYMMVSDDEEYKNARREVRDDNWIIPLPADIPAIKIPIPFEVGMLFKTFPERFIDEFFGREIEPEPLRSITRQLKTTTAVPFLEPAFGFQAFKPIAEVYNNRNTFTNTEIIPYYKQKLEAGLQSRPSTNQLLKDIGETFNISPAKMEHIFRGYTGTLGGYLLDISDVVARGATGEPLIPPSMNNIPVLKRFFLDPTRSGGGLQQQFYELRSEVDTAVQTMNKLRKDGRFDEYSAYRSSVQGVSNVKGQIRAIERYMDNWRRRRDFLLRRTDISPMARGELLAQMEMERDRRLAIVPMLRKKAKEEAIQTTLL